jgi:hypothetical protein
MSHRTVLRRFFAGARGGLDLGYLRKSVEVLLLAPLSLVPGWNEEIRMDEFVKATAPLLAANLLTVALIHSFLKYDRKRESGPLAITVALGLATTYAAPLLAADYV